MSNYWLADRGWVKKAGEACKNFKCVAGVDLGECLKTYLYNIFSSKDFYVYIHPNGFATLGVLICKRGKQVNDFRLDLKYSDLGFSKFAIVGLA